MRPRDVSRLAKLLACRNTKLWDYLDALPIPIGVEPVSLGEGGTPLIRIERIGYGRVYAKFEGTNPTGSFKDRGMTVAVTIARSLRVHGVIVASTGNTAASASAYASRACMSCVVVLPRGKVARGKLSQAILHGAKIIEIEGVFDDALKAVMEFAMKTRMLYPLNSFNPWRLEGQKTIAYEIVSQLGRVPDNIIVPVGNAGNISAIWKGFKELIEWGLINETPRMIGVQASGADPLVRTWESGCDSLIEVSNPKTIATAIRIGRPVNWLKALKAVRESNGLFIRVNDDEILRAQAMLAREGLGVEPASAAAMAGFLKALDQGIVGRDEASVIILTGHCLKDPDAAMAHRFERYIASSKDEAIRMILRIVGGGYEGA